MPTPSGYSVFAFAYFIRFPFDGGSTRCPVVSGIEVSIRRYLNQVPFDHILQACVPC